MEAFATLFATHFADAERSLANTLGGFVDHAARLAANLLPDSPLAAILQAANDETQKLSQQARQAQQALDLSLGGQKLATTQTDEALTAALDRIRTNEANLRGDALVEEAKERQRLYALLYPTGGVQYYTTAALGTEVANRLDAYLATTEAEAATLGATFVRRTQEALKPFRQVREAQVGKLSDTSKAQDARRDLVPLLDAQCDYNYHLLSACFRTRPAQAAAYWNPTYYQRATSRTAPSERSDFEVKAHQQRVLFDLGKYPAAAALALTLREGGPLHLARADNSAAPLPARALLVPAGTKPFAVALAEVPGVGPCLLAYNETNLPARLDAQLS